MHNINIKHLVFESSIPGRTLIITGSIHGNEHCGNEAINRLISNLDSEELSLKSGKLILVPKCNPKAFEQKTRFVERNLNRYLFPKDAKIHYEDYIDPILCGLLKQADVLLDLHSYASQGGPFIFSGNNNEQETAFARDLGVRDFVYGWAEAYSSNNKKDGDKESMGTTEYMRSEGGMGVTLECGQHQNADAADVGYQAILRAMQHLELMETQPRDLKKEQANQRLVKMKEVFYCVEGARFAKDFIHFDPVSKGDALAFSSNNEILYTAPCDGHVVLPKEDSPVGSEWFYFGSVDNF